MPGLCMDWELLNVIVYAWLLRFCFACLSAKTALTGRLFSLKTYTSTTSTNYDPAFLTIFLFLLVLPLSILILSFYTLFRTAFPPLSLSSRSLFETPRRVFDRQRDCWVLRFGDTVTLSASSFHHPLISTALIYIFISFFGSYLCDI
ncbi:hypothetical protein F5Y08DRAFT_280083 [Xylaria arbuscula]|nr:hypothetical protein F5Y08DRAFT_280083 [Xylaria arbuscula]